jgi:hypothetical protein
MKEISTVELSPVLTDADADRSLEYEKYVLRGGSLTREDPPRLETQAVEDQVAAAPGFAKAFKEDSLVSILQNLAVLW